MATKTSNIGNVYDVPRMVISPIMDDQAGILDNNLEPSYVRVRTRNASFSYIDTFDRNSRISNTSYIIASSGELLSKRTKRFALSYYAPSISTPNINPRNNTVTFSAAAAPGVLYTVTIPIGYYTRDQAITALLAALNTVSGASGVVFTAPNQFVNSSIYIVLTGTNAFRISGGTFTQTGHAFWGFPPGDSRFSAVAPFVTTLTLGPITALYSRYYDITSQYVLQHTKAANTGNRVPGNILIRVYTQIVPDPQVTGTVQFESTSENSSWNFDAGASLATIDLNIVDEFGQPYYLPNDETNGSYLQLAFTNEI